MADFFEDKYAIQSLREDDFDDLSAYGEAVDNALQADASEIRIKFETEKKGQRYDIKALAFGDDGHGMDSDTLAKCLKVGWGSRMNSRLGIGRFGVGMILGAIHECKRVEVWSKQKGGKWLWTYIDLDEIESDQLESIPEPVERKVPQQFEDLVDKEGGTLVVWRKYDRQSRDAEKIIEEFRVWLGRTYRYFIWGTDHKGNPIDTVHRTGPVRIWVDSSEVKAVDPLFVRLEKTDFPDDTPAEAYKDMQIDWKADSNAEKPGAKSTITIRMSLIPEEFRQRQGDGGNAKATARQFHTNEGISIMRNHREVFYGTMNWRGGIGGWPRFENIDRWWGGEILFDADIDRAFTVKKIKRGAKPQTQLKLTIKEKMGPTRDTVLEKVREVWKKNKAKDEDEKEKAEAEDLLQRSGNHQLAEKTAKNTPTPKSQLDKDKDIDVEAPKAAESYGDTYDEQQRLRLEELFKSQDFTIMHRDWNGPMFYDPTFLGGKAVLDYNMTHEFWARVYGLVGGLDEEDCDTKQTALEIKAMLDLLVMSNAKAESMFQKDTEYTAMEFVEQMRQNWGLYLRSYVRNRMKELNEDSD